MTLQAAQPGPEVSVVLPARDEAACITGLLRQIDHALSDLPHEVIVVDDGSRDGTAELVRAVSADLPQVRLIRHAVAQGQAAALHNGIQAARGRIIATLDADGQHQPADLARLIAPFLAPDADPWLGLTQGYQRRPFWASRISLRAFRRDTYLRLGYFAHMHRILPLLIRRHGLREQRIAIVLARRAGGRSKYSALHHLWIGGISLLRATWVLRRRGPACGREITDAPAPGTSVKTAS